MPEMTADDLIRAIYSLTSLNALPENLSTEFVDKFGNVAAWRKLKTKSLLRVLQVLEKQDISSNVLESLHNHFMERKNWRNYVELPEGKSSIDWKNLQTKSI